MQEEVRQLIEELRHAVTRPWAVMEVCGGQTHAIASLGLEELLPPGLRLIHGPGCPVCVTAVELIDQAVELSLRPGVVLCSYGDMMRVPGSRGDLFSAKARGGDVLLMYSPLEAVAYAGTHPDTDLDRLSREGFLPAPLKLDVPRWNLENLHRVGPWNWCSKRIPRPEFEDMYIQD